MARSACICLLHGTVKHYRMVCTKSEVKTAGIIVIGDEILRGEVSDANAHYAAKGLHNLGVKLKKDNKSVSEKISIVGDIVNEISEEVKLFSRNYSYVITTGGIGPTHDDVTFEAVAKGFNQPLHHHPELLKICTSFYKTNDVNAPGMKLAHIPKSAVLIYGYDRVTGRKAKYPAIAVNNVFVLPGIPQLFKISFNVICDQVLKSQSKFYSKQIYLNIPEHQIVKALDVLIKEFPLVCVGSYPTMADGEFILRISIESTNESQTAEACKKLLEMIPAEIIITPEEVP